MGFSQKDISVVRRLKRRFRKAKRDARYLLRRLYRLLVVGLPVRVMKARGAGKNPTLVGITVSTRYSDFLSLILEPNMRLLDHWVVVTEESDHPTTELLAGDPRVTVLFWDSQADGRVFDKGSGLRRGQQWAHEHFPQSWYLVVDSDIVLPDSLLEVKKKLPGLSASAIYGAKRVDYHRLSDFTKKEAGIAYKGSEDVYGYFQLYALPHLAEPSFDASWVDIDFRDLFFRREVLRGVEVSHLGVKNNNWQGREVRGGFDLKS
jgi:hypothetical protein